MFRYDGNEYINSKKVGKAVEYLRETDLSIEEISAKLDFSSASYFSRVFNDHMDISPVRYRKMFLNL